MNAQVREGEKNQVIMEVEVPVEEMAIDIKLATKILSNKVNIPGFRKGKVPQSVLENYIGAEAILEEASQGILAKSYSEALAQHGVEPVCPPQIEITNLKKDEPMRYTATITTKPEVTLGEYKGVAVNKRVILVSDEEVEADIDKARSRVAKIVDAPEGEPIKDGDTAVIDFKGFIDGVAFEGGEAADYRLVIGSKSFIPGFEDQLIGLHTGDEKDVVTPFPENYPEKSLAGKEATFKVTVKGIKQKLLPEVNEDFVKEVNEECNTVEEYRDLIRNNLQELKNKNSDAQAKEAAIMKAVENATVDIPKPMIDARIDNIMSDMEQRFQSQGMSMDTYLQYAQTTREKLREDYAETAALGVKTDLVLEAVANLEDFPVSEEDVNGYLEKMSESYWQPVEEIRKAIEQNNAMESVHATIRIMKAEDFIYDNAALTIEEITAEEAAKEAEKAAKEAEKAAKKAAKDAEKAEKADGEEKEKKPRKPRATKKKEETAEASAEKTEVKEEKDGKEE